MSWNYRVIEFAEAKSIPFRQIHEVYYDAEGSPKSYGEDPAIIAWDIGEENMGHDILQLMVSALSKPVLVEDDFYKSKKGRAK